MEYARQDALRKTLGPVGGWRPRAERLAAELASGRRPLLDVQRLFSLFPPEKPAGERLFRQITDYREYPPDEAFGLLAACGLQPAPPHGPMFAEFTRA